jgi:hypothetical protein
MGYHLGSHSFSSALNASTLELAIGNCLGLPLPGVLATMIMRSVTRQIAIRGRMSAASSSEINSTALVLRRSKCTTFRLSLVFPNALFARSQAFLAMNCLINSVPAVKPRAVNVYPPSFVPEMSDAKRLSVAEKLGAS